MRMTTNSRVVNYLYFCGLSPQKFVEIARCRSEFIEIQRRLSNLPVNERVIDTLEAKAVIYG